MENRTRCKGLTLCDSQLKIISKYEPVAFDGAGFFLEEGADLVPNAKKIKNNMAKCAKNTKVS